MEIHTVDLHYTNQHGHFSGKSLFFYGIRIYLVRFGSGTRHFDQTRETGSAPVSAVPRQTSNVADLSSGSSDPRDPVVLQALR